MSRVATLLALTIGVSVAAAPVEGMTVEQVIEKHIAAHGGKSAYDAVRTMKVTGEYTAFSVSSPFTLIRKRENRYRLDRTLNGAPVVIGFDGTTLWWDNALREPGPRRVSEPDLGVWVREAEFVTPFFDYEDRGFQVEMIGETEFEGVPAIGVKVLRPDGADETWYLDPETFLEMARISPGSDFGTPMPQSTTFDDFREVGGLVLPFYVETQWYTRSRMMRVEEVALNADVDDAIFAMPPPVGMGPLQPLAGTFQVAWSQRPGPGADFVDSERTITIESLMDGALLREIYSPEEGGQVIRTISFDKYRETYRMTQFAGDAGYMEIRVGTLDGETGRLTLSNQETGTAHPQYFARLTFFDIGQDGFSVEHEASIDGGESWFVYARGRYSRSAG